MSVKSCVLCVAILLSACNPNAVIPSVDAECVGCAKPESVKLALAVPPPVDLSLYKSIRFTEAKDVVSFSTEDFLKLESLMVTLESRITVLQSMLFSYQNFYEKKPNESVDRPKISGDRK